MPTPRWELFAAVVVFATLALLSLSVASARVLSGDGGHARGDEGTPAERPDEADGGDARDWAEPTDEALDRPAPPLPTGGALLANVALTHGLVAVTVVALAWVAEIPPSALGLDAATAPSVGIGVALGVGIYVASEVGTTVADRVGVDYDERLRELLAPAGPGEWALLLLLVLPIIAVAEELLFRAALIGAFGAGFDVPLWLLVVVSSVLFGAGHGAQGAIGIAVTATLGVILGTAFVLTGSLLVVVVAHYVVNALEFVIREGVLG